MHTTKRRHTKPARMFFIAFALLVFSHVIFGQQIQFNVLYNCPNSSIYNFRVLDCPTAKECNVFFVNSSPDGGYKTEYDKARITAAFRTGQCTIDGKPLAATSAPANSPAVPGATNKPAAIDSGDELAEGRACIASVPAEVKTTATAPNPGLIKRVIYERYRDMESGRPVGITFSSLALSSSFANKQSGGMLIHQSAPVGTMIYRYKTDFFTCVKYTDSILKTTIKEGYFRCFRDKTGHWACADDGRRSWDQTHLPVK